MKNTTHWTYTTRGARAPGPVLVMTLHSETDKVRLTISCDELEQWKIKCNKQVPEIFPDDRLGEMLWDLDDLGMLLPDGQDAAFSSDIEHGSEDNSN